MYFANCTPTLKPAMTASLAIEHTSLCNNSDLCTLAMLRVPGPGVEGCSPFRDFQRESLWRCFLHLQGYGHCCTVYVGMTVSDVLMVDFIGHWISLFIFSVCCATAIALQSIPCIWYHLVEYFWWPFRIRRWGLLQAIELLMDCLCLSCSCVCCVYRFCVQ